MSETIESVPGGSGPIEYAVDGNGKMSKVTVDFKLPSDVKDLGAHVFYYAFAFSEAIKTADLSSLTTISGNYGANSMFANCTKLTSVNLSSLTAIRGNYAFQNAFRTCTSLKELRFPALTADSFGNSTNQFNNMLGSVTGCTLHFPAAIQAKIEAMQGYPNFGGTNTVVLFDL